MCLGAEHWADWADRRLPLLQGAILRMQLGPQRLLLSYVIPAVAGAPAAFVFIRKEIKGISLEPLARETNMRS